MLAVADPFPEVAGSGRESVWAYPRPAIAEPILRRPLIRQRGVVEADTRAAVRTLETRHPPSYHITPADIVMTALRRPTFCEWNGDAVYYDLEIDGEQFVDVA